jgi:hypothetical protein
MRPLVGGLIALVLSLSAAPVFAGGGLPKLGTIQAGPYQAALHNDSPTLVTGANTLTVALAALPDGTTVSLYLDGPNGESIDVPLKPVRVLGGPDAGHGGEEDSHAAGADAHTDSDAAHDDDHGASTAAGHSPKETDAHGTVGTGSGHTSPGVRDSHAAPVPALTTGHGQSSALRSVLSGQGAEEHDHQTAAYQARGTVRLSATGPWTARLTITDDHGVRSFGELTLVARSGGPNRFYIGAVGSLIGGALLLGTIQRRRQPTRSKHAH